MNQDYLEWKHWEASSFGQCPKEADKYLEWHLRRAFPTVRGPLNVLEVGFGNGQFLGFCRSRGFNVTGVELNLQLVERAKKAGYRAVASIEEAVVAGPFDFIVAFDVLEHLSPDALTQFLGMVRGGLLEHGFLLVRVPNGDSPFGRRHQHGDLTHVATYGTFKFHQLAQASGMRVVAAGEAPWYIDESERLTVKAAVRGLLKTVIELVIGFTYYRERVPLDPNLVVLMQKVPGAAR